MEEQIGLAARELGFLAVGFARAEYLDAEARYTRRWIRRNRHGTMKYLENPLRFDPQAFLPGARSVVVVLKNYYNPVRLKLPYKVSMYAYGRDYHLSMREDLERLGEKIRELSPGARFRPFCDSSPVMDKAWARRAGLGWIGKHTNLIRKSVGSYFFIGGLMTDLDLLPSPPVADHCGSCTRCIDACPTGALSPYEIDAARCLSYLTIESKTPLAEEFKPLTEGWAFGCDVCQEVCPWNRFSLPHSDPRYAPLEIWTDDEIVGPRPGSNRRFRRRVAASPLSRVSLPKWLDNVANALAHARPHGH
jgi:epoxyqueuosine reductase